MSIQQIESIIYKYNGILDYSTNFTEYINIAKNLYIFITKHDEEDYKSIYHKIKEDITKNLKLNLIKLRKYRILLERDQDRNLSYTDVVEHNLIYNSYNYYYNYVDIIQKAFLLNADMCDEYNKYYNIINTYTLNKCYEILNIVAGRDYLYFPWHLEVCSVIKNYKDRYDALEFLKLILNY